MATFKVSNYKTNLTASSTPQTLKIIVDCVNGLALAVNTYVLASPAGLIPDHTKTIIIFTLGGVATVFGFISKFIATEEAGTLNS